MVSIEFFVSSWKQLPTLYNDIGIKLLVEVNDSQYQLFICIVFLPSDSQRRKMTGYDMAPAEWRCDGVLVGPIWSVNTEERITREVRHRCREKSISFTTPYQTGKVTRPHYFDPSHDQRKRLAGIYYFPLCRHDDILSLWESLWESGGDQDFISRLLHAIHLAVADILQQKLAPALWNIHVGVLPWKKLQ